MSTETLWNVANLFYLGAYQAAINTAQDLHHLSDNEKVEKDFYVYRAYVALKKYELVQLEISPSQSLALLSVKLLAQYLSDASTKEAVVAQMGEWMLDSVTSANPFVATIAGTLYTLDGNYVEALKACHSCNALETHQVALLFRMALSTQVYLHMNRIDKAEQQISHMSKLDDDATITQLATAWVGVRQGAAKVQEAFYIFQELGDKYRWTSVLHNGSAVCNMVMKRFEEAERDLLDAINKQPNDPNTLSNLTACQLQLGKPALRYFNELKTLDPDHIMEKAGRKAEEEFDRAASAYA